MSRLLPHYTLPLPGHAWHPPKILARLSHAGLVAAGLLAAVVGVQLLYPSGRATPMLSAGYVPVGRQDRAAIQSSLEAFNRTPITLKLNGTTLQFAPAEAGLAADTAAIADEALAYSMRERLRPFSIMRRSKPLTAHRSLDETKLRALADRLAAQHSRPHQNAQLSRSADGSYVITPEKPGIDYDSGAITQALRRTSVYSAAEVSVPGDVIDPPLTAAKYQLAINRITALKQQTIQIVFGTETVSVPGETVAGWAEIVADADNRTVEVTYRRAAVSQWLRGVAGRYAVAAAAATVATHDGVEIRRSTGSNGSAVNTAQTTEAIIASLQANTNEVTATFEPVVSATKFHRTYSPTSQGLQVLIDDWAREVGAGRVGVVFREIGGEGRVATHNADQSFMAASMYKLYVVSYLLDGIAAGLINPNDILLDVRTINRCIDLTILNSSNGCPYAAAARYGWDTINSYMQERGFGASSVKSGNNVVTAASLTAYLEKLQTGNLLNADQTARLLDLMYRQIVRTAIPAGAAPSPVYDKIGYTGSVWHDGGIVKNNDNTYALVVLTDGLGPRQIADLTRRIQATINE